jgi:3-hydroxyisobutyrate dehydrogenase-like beta-hydroxyacid dehydrogenase
MPHPTVAIIAAGNMGAAVGARLVRHGAHVATSLDERSAASARRAAEAGMTAASDGDIARAEFVLSIVPPGEAVALAERLAPALRATDHKPLYIDCNAVSPETVGRVASALAETGCAFVDGGIIGAPPRGDNAGPRIYVSGSESARAAKLGEYGLVIRVMGGAVGDASALKMCYGGLTKGLTALGAALALAAHRANATEALHAELSASRPDLLRYLSGAVPAMFPKAYRFVDEMEEIADFIGMPAERDIYHGLADFYRRLAADEAGPKRDTATLTEFFSQSPTGKR